jgi:tetratricopeptide (TPR) repeat protein
MSVPKDSTARSGHPDLQLEPWQEFKGREDVLKALMKAWLKARQGDPQCVVLLADSGFGKTRLIHEFYRRISSEANGGKNGSGYWPDELSADPTRIDPNPDFEDFDSTGEIPWLWWGMRWGCPMDRNQSQAFGCGVVEWTHHLQRHVAGMINRKAARKVARESLVGAVEAVMDFLPIPNVVGMLNTANDCKEWVKELVEVRRNQRKKFDEKEKTEEKALQAIGFLRAFLDTREKNAVTVPVILVLDDAQWADPISLKVFAQLFARALDEQWPLLLLVTHWETEWRSAGAQKAPEMDAPLDQWNNFRRVEASIMSGAQAGSGFQLHALGKLSDDSIRELLRSKFSGLNVEDTGYVVKRCEGNPLALEEFIKVMQNESQWFEEGDTSRGIDPDYRDEFHSKTLDSENRADQRFIQIAQSNPGLYELLKLGAVQGVTFYHDLLTDLATELKKGDRQWVEQLIPLAENPHCIVYNLRTQLFSSEFRRALYRNGLQKRMKKEWRGYQAALKTVLDRWWKEKKFPHKAAGLRLLELYVRMLEGSESPEDKIQLAPVANRLAVLLKAEGDYTAAEQFYRRAFKARESTLGPEHSDTLTSLNNLAHLLEAKGDSTGAELLYRRELEAKERTLGPEHQETLGRTNELAFFLWFKKDYTAAELLFRREFETNERILGLEHPDTLASISTLAGLLNDKGDPAAEPLIRRVIEVQERTLGPEHPETLKSVNYLALLLTTKGDYPAAQQLYRRIIETKERTLGKEHPGTLGSIIELAGFLSARRDYIAAEKLYRRVVEIEERTLGSEHSDTLMSINCLANLLRDKGDYSAAEHLYRRVLEVRERTVGPEHFSTLRSLYFLALVLRDKGDYSDAEKIWRRRLDMQEKENGPEHPDTLFSIDWLANLLRDREDYSAAEQLYRRALEARTKTLGPESSKTLESINNLANLLKDTSRQEEAELLLRRAEAIRNKKPSGENLS